MINRDESDEPVGVDREQRAGEPRSRVGAQVGGHLYSSASTERLRQAATQCRGEPDMGGSHGGGVRGAVAEEHQPATVEADRGSGQQFLGGRGRGPRVRRALHRMAAPGVDRGAAPGTGGRTGQLPPCRRGRPAHVQVAGRAYRLCAVVTVEVRHDRLNREVKIADGTLHLPPERRMQVAVSVGEQQPPTSGVAQAGQPPVQEESHALGGVRRIGEDQICPGLGHGRQPETQVGEQAADVETPVPGLGVDELQQPLVEVDDGHRQSRHEDAGGQRGEIMIADAQQVCSGEIVGGVHPQRAPGRGLPGCRDVVEVDARRRCRGHEIVHGVHQRAVRGEARRERIAERGASELVETEPVTIRGHQLR